MRKRHIPPHLAQPRHNNDWAPQTRKRHQQEHRPQRPTERSDPTQHAKGRTGDCPGPRKETTTRRNVTQGGVKFWLTCSCHCASIRTLVRFRFFLLHGPPPPTNDGSRVLSPTFQHWPPYGAPPLWTWPFGGPQGWLKNRDFGVTPGNPWAVFVLRSL